MGFYFRKSKKVGPFRLNFSKSGVSASSGVKGARISVGPKGTYVHLGMNGFYYRKKLNFDEPTGDSSILEYTEDSASERIISTSNFENLSDVDSRVFIEEIEEKDRKPLLTPLLGWFPFIVLFVYCLYFINRPIDVAEVKKEYLIINKPLVNIRQEPSTKASVLMQARENDQYELLNSEDSTWSKIKLLRTEDSIGYVYSTLGIPKEIVVSSTKTSLFWKYTWLVMIILGSLFVLFVVWIRFLSKKDEERKSLEIYYTMDEDLKILYNKFLEFFKEFTTSSKVWQKTRAIRSNDVKYTSGASELIDRKSVKSISNDLKPMQNLKTNIPIPCIKLDGIELYFLPERLMLKKDKKYAAIFYRNIQISSTNVRFVESETAPRDAEIISYTWEYVNKRGGPDKRFANNRELPICRYSEYEFWSDAGLNEVIMTSRAGAMESFCEFIRRIGEFQGKLNLT